MNRPFFQWSVVGALLLGGLAAAQPANDTCATAEVLAPALGVTVTSTVGSSLTLLASGAETAVTCGGGLPSPYRTTWYQFTAPSTGEFVIDTCNRANFDTVVQLFEGSCGALVPVGCSDDTPACGNSTSSLSQVLVAGRTYFVQVGGYFTTSVTATSTVQLGVTLRALLARHPDDQCSSTGPRLGLGTVTTVSTLTPDAGAVAASFNDAQLPVDGGCFTGLGHVVSAASGRDSAYQFRADTAGSYSFRLSGFATGAPNHLLYVTSTCVPSTADPVLYEPPVCRAANRRTASVVASEEVWCVPLTANESAWVWFDEVGGADAGATATLEVSACTKEVEPNGTPAEGSPMACPVTGSINPAGDVDYFSLGSPGAGARLFALVDTAATAAAASNYRARVTTATSTLEVDEDDGDGVFGSAAPSLAATPLPGGPVALQVSYFNTTTTSEPYRLYAVVQPPGAATPEVEPNDSLVTASGGPSNYFSGTVSSTTDVDLFAFEARAGDVAFLSLDGHPARTGTTATGNHSLQLWSAAGVALVAVADGNVTVNNTSTTGDLLASSPSAPSEGLWYRIRETGTYYARVDRLLSTGSGEYLLSISLGCEPGGGLGAPTLNALTPATGTSAGGTLVTLSGAGFALGATVRFGAELATVVTRSATTLVVTAPAGSDGATDVSVFNAGNMSSTLPNAFTYFTPIVAPSITALSPASGPTLGATEVTLTGTSFQANAEVSFTVGTDTRPAAAVVVVDATQLVATTPAHLAGLASVTVRNPDDDLSGTLADAFTFLAPPSLSSLTPSTGVTPGGQRVTLIGADFRAGATVYFGSTPGTAVVVASDGLSLTVTAPAAPVDGPVDVTVTNDDAQFATSSGAFAYLFPAPTLVSVTPTEGLPAGGQTITLAGTNFLPPRALPDGGTASVAVTVGGLPAMGVSRVSATLVTAVTPAQGPGTVDVTLTNPDGQQASLAQAFLYVPPPALVAVTPVRGPVVGGTAITVAGTNFRAGATVRVGGVLATGVSVVSATGLTAVTGAATAGLADVSVINPDGQAAVLPGAYTFDPPPTLASVSPGEGSTAGGTVVTLTGTDFRAGATVLFGSIAGASVTLASATQLTALAPAHDAGVVTVVVQNDDGQRAELAAAYLFVAPPTLSNTTPTSGEAAGGTTVRLGGTGFDAQSTVTFGGVTATSVTLVDATRLDVVTPPHAPGAVDVVVTSSRGESATLAGGFTYTRAAPTLLAVVPASGPVDGGTMVSLVGTGFVAGATVTFGGVAASGVTVTSATSLSALTPPHAAGAADVVVTNDDAQAGTLAGAFTYVEAPVEPVVDAGAGGGTGGGSSAGGGDGVSGGCGCASVDGSMLAALALGLLAGSRRRRR